MFTHHRIAALGVLGAMALLSYVSVAQPAVKARDFSADRASIEAIFAAHDRLQPGLDEYMSAVADDIILMPNGGKVVEGKAAYRQHVIDFYTAGTIRIRHEVIGVDSFADVVIARGRAVGSFTPPGGEASEFETRNLFVFRRLDNGKLHVWRIIYNNVPKDS